MTETHIDILELAKWAGAVMAIATLGAFIKKMISDALKPIREIDEKLDKHNSAIRAVLKNSITGAHHDFTAQGKIGRYALHSALDMYEQYKSLGGNSFVHEIMSELKELPIDMGDTPE